MRIPQLIALSLAAIWTCQAQAEIEIYEIDAQYREEVVNLLNRLFNQDTDPNVYPDLYGSVELLPTGQILVDASADRQAEITRVIAAIQRSSPTETPTISLRYWVVFGIPGQQDSATLPTALAEPLRELEAAQGPLGFTLLESAGVVSRAGEEGIMESERFEISQSVYPNGEKINAEVVIEHELQELVTQFSLARGEYLVLGDSAATNEDGTHGMLATIVHWPAGN